MAEHVDFGSYLASRVRFTNDEGRGWEEGLRTFDCPLCGERRGRGWAHTLSLVVGCWNSGCVADPRLAGGGVELVRRLEGLRSVPEAWAFLYRWHPRRGTGVPRRQVAPVVDWVRLPRGEYEWRGCGGRLEEDAIAFAARQWGVGPELLARMGCGRVAEGRHAGRLVIPVVVGGVQVGFLARALYAGVEPKYRNAKSGAWDDPAAECGRSASGWLYYVDAVGVGSRVVLVEGAGDVLALLARPDAAPGHVPVGLLGQALTPQKLGLLAARQPGQVVVALDAGVAEAKRAAEHVGLLAEWGFMAAVGTWVGAKDPGEGAVLAVGGPVPLAALARQRLTRA